jgi:hydrogenase-4 component F
MTALVLLPVIAPLAAAVAGYLLGWRRLTGWLIVGAAAVVLVDAVVLATRVGRTTFVGVGGLARADGLSATMLVVIGAVGTLSCWAGIGYLDGELAHGHTTSRRAKLYAVLTAVFLATMSTAVQANNLGVMWVAIEATTIVTAFLVGHRRTRAALEATWKYVIICSVGIAFAFLGTLVLYFASVHAGAPPAHALDLDVIAARATQLDPGVTRMAAGLLLIGYGAKVGLVPFHTWLAAAHSQAPAPVSALMSGVLLSVAFAALLRVKSVVDTAIGPAYLRVGLVIAGLLTLLVAASLLVVQRDIKRMLAYSSMENMGLIAVAAAAGTGPALAALLLHVLAHGVTKTVLFICAGELQFAHDSTAVADVSALLARSRVLGASFAIGMLALLGFPPFAMFASELAIGRGLADAHLGWALGLALLFVVVAFAGLANNAGRMLLGAPRPDAPAIAPRVTVRVVLVVGATACLLLGIAVGPLVDLLNTAAAGLVGR